MTIRNCQNCEQVIGHLEESYYYYGRFVCRACKIKFESQLNPEAQTVKDSNIENEDSAINKNAATQLSNETFPQKEEPPDSQSMSSALPGCEQSENHNDLPPPSSDTEVGVRGDGPKGTFPFDVGSERGTKMKYPLAILACTAIFIAYTMLGVALGWKHGGGVIPMMILFVVIGAMWRGITKEKQRR